MTHFSKIRISGQWGKVSPDGAFALVESAREASSGVPFALCEVDDQPVAVFLDGDTMAEEIKEALFSSAPAWAGDVAIVRDVPSSTNTEGLVEMSLSKRSSVERCAVAVVCVLHDDGRLSADARTLRVRANSSAIARVSVEFDWDSETWNGDSAMASP